MKSGGLWFKEWLTPYDFHKHRYKKIIVREKTRFQDALIADTYSFGRCLVLDGEIQSAQTDEFIYHEALVHPALVSHPNPSKVLVLGGGEGATLREILKHGSVQKAVMVDIDGEVVRFCKKHLPGWHQGAMDDPRSEVVVGDALKFVETLGEEQDVIISDLPSPMEKGPAWKLYTVEFYRTLKKRLRKGGVFALQSGSGSPLQLELHSKLFRTLSRVFPVVRPYSVYIPSFDVPWSFIFCSPDISRDPLRLTAREIDRSLSDRTSGSLRFYDGTTHEGLFHTPKNLRKILEREKGVITLKKPAFFFK